MDLAKDPGDMGSLATSTTFINNFVFDGQKSYGADLLFEPFRKSRRIFSVTGG